MLRKSWRILVPTLAILMAVLLAAILLSRHALSARVQEMQAIIDGLDPNPGFYSNVTVCKEEAKKMFAVGIGGTPLLIKEINEIVEETGSFTMHCAFYTFGVQVLLCLDADALPGGGYVKGESLSSFELLFQQAKTEIPEILQSHKSVEEKMDDLSKYGVLSLLYLTDEKGHIPKEYEPYLTKIGLQYSPAERAYPSDSAAANPRAFDAQKWLKENRFDLEMLRGFALEVGSE